MPSLKDSMATKEHFKKLEPIAPHTNPRLVSVPPAPQPTYPSYPKFLVTSLPLSVTYQPDALRQFYRGGVPQSRIIPPQ